MILRRLTELTVQLKMAMFSEINFESDEEVDVQYCEESGKFKVNKLLYKLFSGPFGDQPRQEIADSWTTGSPKIRTIFFFFLSTTASLINFRSFTGEN